MTNRMTMELLQYFVLLLCASIVVGKKERVISVASVLGKTEWGLFQKAIFCPPSSNVAGFRLKVGKKSDKDKTGVTGIQLACTDGSQSAESINGPHGEWQGWQYCEQPSTVGTSSSFVTGYNYRSLKNQGRGDDAGGVNVIMKCNNGKELNGGGYDDIGTLDSDTFKGCALTASFCGVQVSIARDAGSGDDTAMNRMKFLCCSQQDIPQDVEPCVKTTGGNVDEDSCCVFPFKYQGKLVSKCTSLDNGENKGRSWCATSSDYDADLKWGNCKVHEDSLINFTRLAGEVCVGTQKKDFGFFISSESGFLSSIKLLHKHGYLTCYHTLPQVSSNFGCNIGHLINTFSVFVTTDDNKVLFPKFVEHARHTFYKLPGNDPLKSKTLTLHDTASPTYITEGEEIRIWYGEDFRNSRSQHDNGFERACYDVYAQFLS